MKYYFASIDEENIMATSNSNGSEYVTDVDLTRLLTILSRVMGRNFSEVRDCVEGLFCNGESSNADLFLPSELNALKELTSLLRLFDAGKEHFDGGRSFTWIFVNMNTGKNCAWSHVIC